MLNDLKKCKHTHEYTIGKLSFHKPWNFFGTIFFRATNAEFVQGYGLTETSPLCTITPNGFKNYGTIGWPVSNVEMKIVSLDDHTYKGQAVNKTGELWARGPNIMKGYFKNDDATKATITADGWLR